MYPRAKRSSRSVDYLLSVLSPREVAISTRRYIEALSPEELDTLVAHSTARMDDDERASLAMAADLVTFLEQHRRSLRTLDADALRAILLPVIASEPGEALVSHLRNALPAPSHATAWRRLRDPLLRYADAASRGARAGLTAVAIAACGLAGVLIGLFGMRMLLAPAGPAPPAAPAHAAHAAHVALATARPSRPPHIAPRAAPRIRPAKRAPVRAPAPHRQIVVHRAVAVRPRPTQAPTPSPTVAPRRRRVRLAAAPVRSVHRKVLKVAAAPPIPAGEPHLVQRARLIVMSYLDSLMRGDASAALGNLGLSASAGTSNLTEAPILAGATEFRIVHAALSDKKNAKVQVVIDSPQGRYFGDYIVSASGPAAWITAHEVIPVGNRRL